jgi:GNAT superfamily N-acetyltransferase
MDGKPIGLTWGRIEKDNLEVATVYQVWVAPTHRRLGVGKMLMEAAISWACSMHANYLDLGVTYGDTPAMRLYQRLGFEPRKPQLLPWIRAVGAADEAHIEPVILCCSGLEIKRWK